MTPLFDAHCHLDADHDFIAPTPGPVSGRLLCGVSPDDWPLIRRTIPQWPGSVAAYGVHPWRIDGEDKFLSRLEELLVSDPLAWLGEIGLDGLKTGLAPLEIQRQIFSLQLRLAKKLGRRINLHCVKAWEPLAAALDAEYLADGPRRFIIHSFNGPHQFIKLLAARGAYFSIGPLAARHDSRRTRERAALLPLDRLLLESDANLVPGRDAWEDLEFSLNWLAGIHNTEPDILARHIADNTRRLFDHDQ